MHDPDFDGVGGIGLEGETPIAITEAESAKAFNNVLRCMIHS